MAAPGGQRPGGVSGTRAGSAAVGALAPPAAALQPRPIGPYATMLAGGAPPSGYAHTMSHTHTQAPGEEDMSPAVEWLSFDDDSKMDMKEALKAMFADETRRIHALNVKADTDFKTLTDLPLARIKRIMKSDEDVRMISAEAPVLFAKACELFILDLTIRSLCHSSDDKAKGGRRCLARSDVLTAVLDTPELDFLVGVMMPGKKPRYLTDGDAAYGGHVGAQRATAMPVGVPRPLPVDASAALRPAPRGAPSSSAYATLASGSHLGAQDSADKPSGTAV